MAVVGHVGCGHCHSFNNQAQDDSAGLATVLKLFQEATGLSLVIKNIVIKTGIDGYVEVETEDGGHGRATPPARYYTSGTSLSQISYWQRSALYSSPRYGGLWFLLRARGS